MHSSLWKRASKLGRACRPFKKSAGASKLSQVCPDASMADGIVPTPSAAGVDASALTSVDSRDAHESVGPSGGQTRAAMASTRPSASTSVGFTDPQGASVWPSDHLAWAASIWLSEDAESSDSLPWDASSNVSYGFIDDLPEYVSALPQGAEPSDTSSSVSYGFIDDLPEQVSALPQGAEPSDTSSSVSYGFIDDLPEDVSALPQGAVPSDTSSSVSYGFIDDLPEDVSALPQGAEPSDTSSSVSYAFIDDLPEDVSALPQGAESSDTSSNVPYGFIDDLPDDVFEPEVALGSDDEA